MSVVDLRGMGYIPVMEVLSHLHISRDVLLTLACEMLLAGALWAGNQFALKIRGWFYGIHLMRQQIACLQREAMSLRADLMCAQSRQSTPPIPLVIPPPIPTTKTHMISDEELKEGWEDDEDKTGTPPP